MTAAKTAAALRLRASCAVLLLFLAPLASLAEDLHAPWQALLSAHVRDGQVDYQGFKRDQPALDRYLAELDATRPGQLAKDQQLAYYINGYNAYTVLLILEHFRDGRPVRSIKDIGGLFSSPWSIRFVRLGGELLTLDMVEHEILRPRFGDPRIHFAINCASLGCPPLRDEAYRGDRIDRQLDDSTTRFINDPQFTYVKDNTLYLSKIFDWFGDDFVAGAVPFVRRYADQPLAGRLEAAGSGLRLKYLPYDWSLNDLGRRGK